MQSNTLFIISAPSGCGKTSIARAVMDNEIISFTTREMRQGEVQGRDYQFITEDEFQHLLKSDGLAEYTTYYGSASYGITMEELSSKLVKGNAFVVVDVIGKAQLEQLWDRTVSIFIWMPDKEEAARRMRERGDSEEAIIKRLKTFDEEVANFPLYDYLLDNTGSFEDSVVAFKTIVGEYE